MTEMSGDLWLGDPDIRVITTNGSVRRDGKAVMGRGCAFEATIQYPHLQEELGRLVSRYGNRMYWFPQYKLATFPVKHRWMDAADLELIKTSVQQLKNLMLVVEHRPTVFMPRPGCGNGRLTWEMVKPLLVSLPDNVHVYDYSGEK